MLAVILFIYPTICSKVFMTFKCVDVGEAGQFMVADMSVACFEGDWLVWAAVAGAAMVFYVVGIPIACVVLLWIAHRRGVLQYPTPFQINDETQIIPSVIAESVRRTNTHFHIYVAFSSLYEQYDAMFWWFESCCTMRKMILTGAMVLFSAGTTPQVVTALAVCIFWFGLIANLKPFGENVDDFLAQVEGLQVLFTLLIGLVLQLEAKTGDEADQKSLGIVLIAINCIVVVLAAIQQPIVISVASRVTEVCRRCKQRARAHQEWEAVWIVPPTDRQFKKSQTLELSGVNGLYELATDSWCDTASHPPRLMKAIPIALVHDQTKLMRGEEDAQSWFFDTEWNVVKDPCRTVEPATGAERWIDLRTKRLLDAPPTELFEARKFSDATHFLNPTTHALLRSKPGLLVLTETEGARPAWHHRVRKTLTEANPGLPETSASEEDENVASELDFSGKFANPRTALEETRAGQSVEMTIRRNELAAAAPEDEAEQLSTPCQMARARRIAVRKASGKRLSTDETEPATGRGARRGRRVDVQRPRGKKPSRG
jgi:hypothetical protein